MKYHGHEIRKKLEDLGYSEKSMNYVYEIWKDGKYINVAWSLGTAKDYIDSGYDQRYL